MTALVFTLGEFVALRFDPGDNFAFGHRGAVSVHEDYADLGLNREAMAGEGLVHQQAVTQTTSRLSPSICFEVQFDSGGSGAPSRIHQDEAFSVLIHLGLAIARFLFSTLGFQNLKSRRSFVLCLGYRLQ
ncbi:hypothetical protein V8G54_011705 [Vigna mungo]|uniref:Uncharacterized protein n=1 Tax=Vigna mungo TaxID=3915 RepID=A0AAQ3RZV4_VIGMU